MNTEHFDQRISITLKPSEVGAIEAYREAVQAPSRAEAVRQLMRKAMETMEAVDGDL